MLRPRGGHKQFVGCACGRAKGSAPGLLGPSMCPCCVVLDQLQALRGVAHTPRWDWDHAVNTRIRIRCLGTYGMEPGDADHWKARTREIDGATKQSIVAYIEELDARVRELDGQLRKERLRRIGG